MTRPRVVAIDGAAGSGKSTLARRLAIALRLPYINTGLMYRAVTARALRLGVAPEDGPSLAALVEGLSFSVRGADPPELDVEGYELSELTSVDVESTVSAVAAHEPVRALLRALQRRAADGRGAVMEGRDIGSVVFPDAPVKIYLVADLDVRAERRAGERPSLDAASAASLATRDASDARTNPLEATPTAVVLDTTAADVDETLARALDIVRTQAPELIP